MKQKTFKIIEVPAYIDGEGIVLCKSKNDKWCYYFDWPGCESIDKFPNCSNKKIVYLKVEDND